MVDAVLVIYVYMFSAIGSSWVEAALEVILPAVALV
jgi:hypothetical protein